MSQAENKRMGTMYLKQLLNNRSKDLKKVKNKN